MWRIQRICVIYNYLNELLQFIAKNVCAVLKSKWKNEKSFHRILYLRFNLFERENCSEWAKRINLKTVHTWITTWESSSDNFYDIWVFYKFATALTTLYRFGSSIHFILRFSIILRMRSWNLFLCALKQKDSRRPERIFMCFVVAAAGWRERKH